MDAHELLLSWPGFECLDASAILAHPAWRMPVGYEDDGMFLVVDESETPTPDELLLTVTLDDAENILGISDSPEYADLHRLWSRRAELPKALVIALVEKEAGTLLQAVENLTRKELRLVGVTGVADIGDGCNRRSFRLETSGGASSFSLCLPTDVVAAIGVLDNLDPLHESIQSLTRPAQAEYAVIDAAPKAVSSLMSGDFLLSAPAPSASWQTELPDDPYLRLRGEAEENFTFAQFVSEELPPVPPPVSFAVYCHGRKIAAAKPAKIGDVTGYCIL